MSRRAILALGAALAVFAGLLVVASGAAAVAVPRGRFNSASQLTSTHAVTITGWAFDPARPRSEVVVQVYLDGRYAARATTNVGRPDVNRVFHISGVHGFRLVVRAAKQATTVLIRTTSQASGRSITLASKRISQFASPGARILALARTFYTAHVPYRDGGTTPRGFDCSGYTQYVYRVAGVASLPRTAEQQRRATKRIARSRLLPGDLIFYLSGGSAYHVAIYAGNGMQYAEATVRDGLRYQKIWSSAVQYGTSWH